MILYQVTNLNDVDEWYTALGPAKNALAYRRQTKEGNSVHFPFILKKYTTNLKTKELLTAILNGSGWAHDITTIG